MKRRWWIVLGSAGFAVVAAVFALSMLSNDPVNSEYFAKIQECRTEADVVLLLGRPADDVAHLVLVEEAWIDKAGARFEKTRTLLQKTWRGSRRNICVVFDQDGTVEGDSARYYEADTIFSSIRRWFNLDPPITPPMAMPAMATPPYALPNKSDNLEAAAKDAFDDPQPE